MAQTNGPVIVRYAPANHLVKPGLHSHNVTRRLRRDRSAPGFLLIARFLLLVFGLCALGYYGYTLGDQYVYQSYENWAFDQQIAGNSAVTFADYLRARTPFGLVVGPASKSAVSTQATAPSSAPQPVRPAEGDVLGRVEIPRLNVSAMVREGVDAKTLSMAVGHVPSTALPGQIGNFAIAAHRDTLFRALKDIKKDDLVTFRSGNGSYTYEVLGTRIVKPSDVSVLRSDGGGVIESGGDPAQPVDSSRLLTMITCYPFYYVGSAPKRFIVEAELVRNVSEQAPAQSVPEHARAAAVHKPVRRHATVASVPAAHPKKRSLWRRLLHVS